MKDLVGKRDICFGGVGGAIEYSITGLGYINCKAVFTAVLYGGVDGVADAGSCGGKVTDVICKLYGGNGYIMEVGWVTVGAEGKYKGLQQRG